MPALKRGLQMIELISRMQPMGFNQLQQETQFNTSSLNRLLKTLVEYDYVKKNTEGKYELGIKLFTLVYGNSAWHSLSYDIHKILENISMQFGVTAIFVVYLRAGCLVLDKVICPDNVAMRSVGDLSADYLYNPWGFLRLFSMSKESQHEWLDKPCTLEKEQYYAFADFIQQNGYADDQNMLDKNMRRLAVPIYDKNNRLTASIAVGSFVNLLDDEKARIIAHTLQMQAKEFSSKIQFESNKM